jgi:hypothetical protein
VISLPGRAFELEVFFLRRLRDAINAHPVLGPLVTAEIGPSGGILVSATEARSYPEDWISSSANLATESLVAGRLGSDGRKVVAMEYYIDTPQAPGSGTPIALNPGEAFEASFDSLSIPLGSLRAGTHEIALRSRNAAGNWGAPIYRRFTAFALVGTNDLVAPVISLSGGAAVDATFGVPFVEPGYSATDETDGDLSASVRVEGAVDPSLPGIYFLVYRVHDLAGNRAELTRTVTVPDEDAPQFTGSMALNYTSPPAIVDLFSGLGADDPQYGDLSHRIELLSSDVNWFAEGNYQANFRVSDYSGLSTVVQRTISIGAGALFYPAYANWMAPRAAASGASGAALDASADPDGDGATNQQEWLAETDPFDNDSSLRLAYTRGQASEDFSWFTQLRVNYTLLESDEPDSTPTVLAPLFQGQACYTNMSFSADALVEHRFYHLDAIPALPIAP